MNTDRIVLAPFVSFCQVEIKTKETQARPHLMFENSKRLNRIDTSIRSLSAQPLGGLLQNGLTRDTFSTIAM